MSYAISIGFLVLTALHAPVAGVIPDLIRISAAWVMYDIA